MRARALAAATAAFIAVTLAGCASTAPSPAATSTAASNPAAPTPTSQTLTEETAVDSIVGTVVRFTAPGGSIDVTIDEDNPATRDFLSMLPITLTFEDFAGREKIAYPPRDVEFAGSPPSSAGAGDLAIYTPWGNLAFFYDGERGAPSEQVVHLGTFDASPEDLELLESGEVTVAVVE